MGGDTNLYAYVWGDPVNVVDPEGLGGWGLSDALGVVSGPFNLAADTIDWASYETGFTGAANAAAAFYASVAADPDTPLLIKWVATVEGGFASLAACDNAGDTAVTLAVVGGAARRYEIRLLERQRRGGRGIVVLYRRSGNRRLGAIDRHPYPGTNGEAKVHIDIPPWDVHHWPPRG